MQIFNPDYLKKLLKKYGPTYVLVNGSKYMSTYLLHFVMTPVYLQRLKALPTTMSIKAVLKFTNEDCYQAFQPLQYTFEITKLLEHVKKMKPKVVVEIGTANGGTLLSMIKVAPKDASFVSIDLPAGEFGGGYAWYKIPLLKAFVSGKQSLHLLRADSHKLETRQQLEKILAGQPIDFLFIDGDHTFKGVKQDFELYSPLVRKGGSIAFHDIVPHAKELNTEVDKFWNKISKKYPSKTFVENWKQGMCGIGVLTNRKKSRV